MRKRHHPSQQTAPNKRQNNKAQTSELDKINLHPLLSNAATSVANPLKQSKKSSTVHAKNEWNVNPYYDPSVEFKSIEKSKSLKLPNSTETKELTAEDILKASLKARESRQLKYQEELAKLRDQANNLKESREEKAKEAAYWHRREKLGLLVNFSANEDKWLPTRPDYIEWWDSPLLIKSQYPDADNFGKETVTYFDPNNESNPITSFIQHPMPISAPYNRLIPPPQPLHLTKAERKRLRKNTRHLALKEKQDRIKLGLDPPPPQKIKLSNLPQILQTVKNPTAVEMQVKQEIAQREAKHIKDNQDRKQLAAAQNNKSQKRLKQNENDVGKGLWRLVFKIKNFSCGKNRYKVDMNAKQLNVTGVSTMSPTGSVVIVEGGKKQVGKMKSLMMRRIDWSLNEPTIKKGMKVENTSDYTEPLVGNICELVWEGEILDRKFQKWSFYDYDDSERMVDWLRQFGMENYA